MNSIPVADMITAFRYVFGAAAALMAGAALCMIADGGAAAGRPVDAGGDGGVGRGGSARGITWLSLRRDLI